MRHPMRHLVLAVLLVAGCDSRRSTPTAPAPTPAPMAAPQPLTASYEVTFDAAWSKATHPQDFPSNPHFSPLVGATHDARATFWREGSLASRGIEKMAELGSTSPLDQEIQNAIDAGLAEHLLLGGPIGRSPGRASISFEISQNYSLVTLVSMVAPSPDWFVGVSRLDLFAGGVWASEIVVQLYPWDAGTDNGMTFASPNAEAVPHGPITRIDTAPLAPSGSATPLGSFTFRRTG